MGSYCPTLDSLILCGGRVGRTFVLLPIIPQEARAPKLFKRSHLCGGAKVFKITNFQPFFLPWFLLKSQNNLNQTCTRGLKFAECQEKLIKRSIHCLYIVQRRYIFSSLPTKNILRFLRGRLSTCSLENFQSPQDRFVLPQFITLSSLLVMVGANKLFFDLRRKFSIGFARQPTGLL